MSQFFPALTTEHRAFIGTQHIFFTASADAEGPVNLSPKGMDSFRVLDDATVAYLDLTGSGNETAAHLLADGRLTIMFCAFQGSPLILRLYGRGETISRVDLRYRPLVDQHFGGDEPPGTRQIIVQSVEQVQTSCGYAVPAYAYKGDRPGLIRWAENKGDEGLRTYRAAKNRKSLAGLPTGLVEPPPGDAPARPSDILTRRQRQGELFR
jgi:hypothetical protein